MFRKLLNGIIIAGIIMLAFTGLASSGIFEAGRRVERVRYEAPKPDPVLFEDFFFTVGTLLKWGIYVILALLLSYGAVWLVVRMHRSFTREVYYAEDGVFPTVLINTASIAERLRGIRKGVTLHLNNAGVTSTAFLAAGDRVEFASDQPDWTATHQERVAATSKRTQALAGMSTGGGIFGRDGIRNKAQAAALLGQDVYAQRGRPALPGPQVRVIEDEADRPMLPAGDAPTFDSVAYESTPSRIVTGYDTATHGLHYWDVKKFPHCRIHGTTGSGKTTFTQTLIYSLLSAGWQMAIFDRRGLKDYRMFTDTAQLIDTRDAMTMVQGATLFAKLNDMRERQFAEAATRYDAPADIGEYEEMTGRKVPRIGIVIDEWLAQVEAIRMLDDKGKTAKQFFGNMKATVAQCRSNGIHFIFVDQKPTAEYWDAAMKANVSGVFTGYIPKGSGRSAGNYYAHTLDKHEFFAGEGRDEDDTRIKSWPMARTLRERGLTVPDLLPDAVTRYDAVFPTIDGDIVSATTERQRIDVTDSDGDTAWIDSDGDGIIDVSELHDMSGAIDIDTDDIDVDLSDVSLTDFQAFAQRVLDTWLERFGSVDDIPKAAFVHDAVEKTGMTRQHAYRLFDRWADGRLEAV